MKSRLFLITALGLTLLGCAVGWLEKSRRAIDRVAARRTEIEQSALALKAERRGWEVRRQAAERESEALRTARAVFEKARPTPSFRALVSPSNPAAKPTADAPKVVDAIRATAARGPELEKSPEWQRLQIAALRSDIRAIYSPLYRALGLSAAQIQQFEEAALRREETRFDLSAMLRTGQLSLQTPEGVKVWMKMEESFNEIIRMLLADEGHFQRFKDYERGRITRGFTADLAADALVAGVTFSPAQLEQLVATVTGASATFRKGQASNSLDLDWPAIDAGATAFLDSVQLAWLKTKSVARLNNEFNRLAQLADAADRASAGKK